MEALIQYFSQSLALNRAEKEALRTLVPVRQVPKGAYLLREGEISHEFFFILKGCIRLFYRLDPEEKTAFFYTENQFVSAYESYTRQLPSRHSFQALEDTEVAVISRELASDLLARFPRFEWLARLAMEQELIVYQEVISTFVLMNPEERYRNLLQRQPDLIQRIPQHYLATFLGVAPETLSRIRKRVADKDRS
ncbi:MAG: Crp/Fnr family transcriptional regulator [Bacteroidota bacterium]